MTALLDAMREEARKSGIPLAINHLGSMAGIFFHNGPVETFDEVMASDAAKYTKFFHLMLDKGVYLAPSAYEAMFVSAAHTDLIIESEIELFEESLAAA